MTRAFTLAAVLAPPLSLAACAPTGTERAAATAPAGEVIQSGCRQGECAWLRVVRVDKIETRPEGELRRIVARRGRSVHLDGNLPAGPADADIEWEAKDVEDYAFCSTRRPAFAFPGDDGGLIVHFLDLFDLGGYQMTSASLYMRFCHDQPGLPDEQKLGALGYASGTRAEQVEAAGPEVMMRF
jgi:hypothetical protein